MLLIYKQNRMISIKMKNMQVIYVVCGIGEILNLLKNLYPNVALNGINISDEMLKIARDKFPVNAKLYLCDAKYLTFKNESFY